MPTKFQSVEEYVSSFAPDVQAILKKARRAIRKAAPGAEEVISYQIIVFKVNGKRMVYLGGWKNHVGLYPIPVFDQEFEEEVSAYRQPKTRSNFPCESPFRTT